MSNVWRAFDEASFGRARTLNLRGSLPSAREAVARVEQWLRQQQVARAGSVLVITGRGNNSPEGISAVREAVMKHLHSLRRRGVIRSWREHTPGSVVIELAPVSALFEQIPRRREPRVDPVSDPESFQALSPAARALLRRLALRSLETLGIRDPARYVEAEMLKQFAALSASLPRDGDRDAALQVAMRNALEELDG
ncbi:MAG TPA: Smr/MutS family protein [Gemmatimonadaceae bacterium]|nr:Smr/MutS family protein [Gemmatimonadaceae bacterium]